MREANVRSLVHCSRLGANVYEPIRPGRIQRRAVERLGGGIEKRHSSNRTGAIRAHATHDRRCVHAAGRGKENSRDFCLAQTVDWVLKLPSPINRGLAKLCSAVWSSGMIRSDAIDVVRLKLSRSLSQEIDMAVPYLVSQDQSPLPVAGSISPWSAWGMVAVGAVLAIVIGTWLVWFSASVQRKFQEEDIRAACQRVMPETVERCVDTVIIQRGGARR